MATYEIPEENLSRLTSKLQALAKRAAKLGFESFTYSVGQPFEREVVSAPPEPGEEYLAPNVVVRYFPVTVDGAAPQVAGWRFAAVADYQEEPVVVRALLRDVQVPQRYRSCGPLCEHCRLQRDRRECVILVHEDGSFKQVGKSCLKDFLGHPSPDDLAAVASIIREVEDACSEGREEDGGSYGDPTLLRVLAWASCIVRHRGWCPKSKEDFDAEVNPNGRVSTATIVAEHMYQYEVCQKKWQPFPFPVPTQVDLERAQAAVEYAKGLKGDSDYAENVRAVAARSGVSSKNFGLAVSIMGSYDREQAAKAETRDKSFVGAVGKKVHCRCTKKTCKCPPIRVFVTRVVTLADYGFGVNYRNLFTDAAGNVLTWKTQECLETGAYYDLTGTVKAHEDDRYGKQTVLTRCRIAVVSAPAHSAPAHSADEILTRPLTTL